MEKRRSQGASSSRPTGPHDPLNTDLGEHRDDKSSVRTSQLPSDIDSLREPRSKMPETKGKDPERNSPPPPEDTPMDDPDAVPASASELGKPMFTGEHEELQGLWFHMRIKSILDPKLSLSDERKCAYLASCMKGRALTWLTEIHTRDPRVLTNYNNLERMVNEAFDLPEAVKIRLAERKIMKLRQTASVLHYQSDFDSLVIKLKWPESAKKALFFAGLKTALQEKLILTNSIDTYSEMKDEAIRLDAALANSVGQAADAKKKKNKTKEKCGKCGRTNHATKDCYAKTTQAITYEGASPPSGSNYIRKIRLQNQELSALVDTGSKLNVMRRSLAKTEKFPSEINILDPVGKEMEHHASFVLDKIDGIVLKFYLVDGLLEEVILGEPYLGGGGET